MKTYHEVLPASKTDRQAIRWTPAEADYEPVAGVLAILGKRNVTEYLVTEFPCGFDGRGFQLDKVTSGTDPEAEGYACFVARNGQDRSCECKGFIRWGHQCKHLAAISALISNGWL